MRFLALLVLSFALIVALTPRPAAACASGQARGCASMDCTMADMCEEGASACAVCCAAACVVAAAPAREGFAPLSPVHPRFAPAPFERVRGLHRSHDPLCLVERVRSTRAQRTADIAATRHNGK